MKLRTIKFIITTLYIRGFSIRTPSLFDTQHNVTHSTLSKLNLNAYSACQFRVSFSLNVTIKSTMLRITMLIIIMLSVFVLNVTMHYKAEGHYADA